MQASSASGRTISNREGCVQWSAIHIPWLIFPVESCPYLFSAHSMGCNMLELNLIFARIKDMQGRIEALRGYL